MSLLQQAETALLRLQSHLATRRRDLAIAQKAGPETSEIERQIVIAEGKISTAEQLILRLTKEIRK